MENPPPLPSKPSKINIKSHSTETVVEHPPPLPTKPNKLRSNSIVTGGENPPPLPSKPKLEIKTRTIENDDTDTGISKENNEKPPPLPPKKKKRNVPPPLPKKPTFYKMRENEESVIFNEEQMVVFLDLEKSIEEQINTKMENMRNRKPTETNNVMLDSCSNLKLALRRKESVEIDNHQSDNKSFSHKAMDKAKDKLNRLNDLIKVGIVGSDTNLVSDIENGKSTLEIKTWFNKSSSNVVNESKLLKWGKTSFNIDEKTEGLSFIKALVDDYLIEKIENPNLETERHFRILDIEERRRTKRKNKYEKKEDEFSFLMLMSAQKKTYPRLIIPFVIYYLCEKVKELGGKESEGIFRLAIDQEQAKDYLEQIKQYGLIDIRERDPNIPAVVLKRVLGKLEPILTPNFFIYYECITSKGEEDYQKIWEKLPPFNQQIAIYFCSFINEMLDESVVKKTKMDLKNLAIVFAPSVVVDYGLDTVESLKNAPQEMDFFIKYVNWIIKNKLSELLPIDLSSHPLPKTTVLRIHRKLSNVSSSKDANEDRTSSCLDSEDVLSSSSEFVQTEELVEKNK